ncbi:hypothetical protein ACFWVB_38095 [Streptomyces microflavus]|uniref:hypothetical protein n=1 Tax=Streptomyces microflavus TaxID=1919 RepID=UPI00366418F5
MQFSDGPAPEHLLAHVDRVDAAAAWEEENCPAWFEAGPLPLHTFNCNGELPTYLRSGVPDCPLRLSDVPAAIANVAVLVELHRAVKDTLLRKTAAEHPWEVVRAMVTAVADAYGGHPPKDDATVLCLDWHGPRPEPTAENS